MNICFQIIPNGDSVDQSVFTTTMRDELMKRGNFMVNIANDKENGYFFRLVLNQWSLNKEILEELISELDLIADQLFC